MSKVSAEANQKSGRLIETFDQVLEAAGSASTYQLINYLIFAVMQHFVSLCGYIIVGLAGYIPSHHCTDLTTNLSIAGANNALEHMCNTTQLHSINATMICEQKQTNMGSVSLMTKHAAEICAPGSAMRKLKGMKVLDLLYAIGMLCGAILGGLTVARIGRFWGVFILFGGNMIVAFISAAVPSPYIAVFANLMIGIFNTGYFVADFTYLTEVLHVKYRLYPQALNGYMVTQMVTPLIIELYPNFVHIMLFAPCVGLVVCLPAFLIFGRESPRWLLARNLVKRAQKIVECIARINKRVLPPVDYEKVVANIRKFQEQGQKYGYKDLFSTLRMTQHILVLMFSWFTASSVTYGVLFTLNKQALSLSLLLLVNALGTVIGSVATLLTNRFVSRQWMQRLSLAGCFSMTTLIAIVTFLHSPGATRQLVAWDYVFLCGIAVTMSFTVPMWTIAYLYSAELFPTAVRPMATGSCSMVARIGTVVTAGIQMKLELPGVFLWFSVLLAINLLLVILYLPETKNKPLPDAMPEPEQFCCCKKSGTKKATEIQESGDKEKKTGEQPLDEKTQNSPQEDQTQTSSPEESKTVEEVTQKSKQ